MILRALAIVLSIFITTTGYAEPVKILKCQSQHSMFDPDYVQGSEVYGDVFYESATNKAALVVDSGEKGKTTLYSFNESTKVNFSVQHSSGFLQWTLENEETDYAALGYLGGPWGFVIEVSEQHSNKAWAGTEIEMMCKETDNFDLALK